MAVIDYISKETRKPTTIKCNKFENKINKGELDWN